MKRTVLAIALATMTIVGKSQAGWLGDIGDAFSASSLTKATNYSFEPYATYAPKLANKNDRFGGGALVFYNLNNNVAAGLGVDYLGRFSLVSGDLTLKLPIKPFSTLASTNSFWHNVTVTPFVLGGIGKPLSGTSSGVAAIADVGAALSFGHLWGGQFNTGFAWGQWLNADPYSGERYHVFFGWSKKF